MTFPFCRGIVKEENGRKKVIDMTQSERIKEIRKTLNLTLEKFGEKLGVKKNTVSQLENGRNSLTEQMAKAICREFNVNYDYLVNGEGDMFSNLPQTILDELCNQYDLDALDRLIVEMYIGLPSQDRERVKEEIKKLANRFSEME